MSLYNLEIDRGEARAMLVLLAIEMASLQHETLKHKYSESPTYIVNALPYLHKLYNKVTALNDLIEIEDVKK